MEFLYANNGVLYCGKNPIIPRGMGLGGWLLPEGYMWKFYTKCDRPRHMETLINELCGENYADSFWKRYFDSYISFNTRFNNSIYKFCIICIFINISRSNSKI